MKFLGWLVYSKELNFKFKKLVIKLINMYIKWWFVLFMFIWLYKWIEIGFMIMYKKVDKVVIFVELFNYEVCYWLFDRKSVLLLFVV